MTCNRSQTEGTCLSSSTARSLNFLSPLFFRNQFAEIPSGGGSGRSHETKKSSGGRRQAKPKAVRVSAGGAEEKGRWTTMGGKKVGLYVTSLLSQLANFRQLLCLQARSSELQIPLITVYLRTTV